INDISAMRAFFPAVIAAAQVVGSTDSLISSLTADIAKLSEIPRTNSARDQATTPSSDSTNIFAYSTQPTAKVNNVENDDLDLERFGHRLRSGQVESARAVPERRPRVRRARGGKRRNRQRAQPVGNGAGDRPGRARPDRRRRHSGQHPLNQRPTRAGVLNQE